MVEDSAPPSPCWCAPTGGSKAPPKLAGWLGLDAVPQYLTELAAADGETRAGGKPGGIPAAQLADAGRIGTAHAENRRALSHGGVAQRIAAQPRRCAGT